MSDQIKVNYADIAEKSLMLQRKANEIVIKELSCEDVKTTIPANKKSRRNFNSSQNSFKKIGEALNQESVNLKSIGISFKSMDESQANAIGK